jgi:hypothetical protein
MTSSSSQATVAGTTASAPGRPTDTSAPRMSAAVAANITGATTGARSRFVAGDTSDRRPKSTRTSGSVAA